MEENPDIQNIYDFSEKIYNKNEEKELRPDFNSNTYL